MKRKLTSWIMILAFFGTTTLPLQAAMISTPDVIAVEQSQYDRAQLIALLDREDVQSQLLAMGVSAEQAAERVNSMTDLEVAELNQRLADLPAGAGVLSVVVIIFVVFVITDAIGATNIFSFVRPVR
ncbi:MAG: PA2779 family protein [Methylophaga sp.]|nr:PA2779 family protein [Methylophaga sp.]